MPPGRWKDLIVGTSAKHAEWLQPQRLFDIFVWYLKHEKFNWQTAFVRIWIPQWKKSLTVFFARGRWGWLNHERCGDDFSQVNHDESVFSLEIRWIYLYLSIIKWGAWVLVHNMYHLKKMFTQQQCVLYCIPKKNYISRTSQLNIIKVAYGCIFQTSWDRIVHNRSRNLIEIGNSFSFLVSCKPTRVQRDSKCSECASFDNPSESNHESPPLL
jgi:hypothetical protein